MKFLWNSNPCPLKMTTSFKFLIAILTCILIQGSLACELLTCRPLNDKRVAKVTVYTSTWLALYNSQCHRCAVQVVLQDPLLNAPPYSKTYTNKNTRTHSQSRPSCQHCNARVLHCAQGVEYALFEVLGVFVVWDAVVFGVGCIRRLRNRMLRHS